MSKYAQRAARLAKEFASMSLSEKSLREILTAQFEAVAKSAAKKK